MSSTKIGSPKRRRMTAALAASIGGLASLLPISSPFPVGTAHAALQQIAFESSPPSALVTLGNLASRTERKPVTRGGIGPYTISGTDSRTSSPYSFVTDESYNPANPAYANEGDEGTVSSSFTATIGTIPTDAVDTSRTNVMRLFSQTNCTNQNNLGGVPGYCSLFGPEVWSEPFDATLGQAVSFDWRATGASDDYEIYAFLVAVDETMPGTFDYGTNSTHTLLAYGRGQTTGWTTASANVPAADSYRFRFVNGSYDGTGGLALGSEMFIDSVVKVGTANPITFPALGDKILGAAPFALNATSPSGPVSYTSATPGKCTVSGSTVSLVASQLGVCTIVANQAGDGVDYVPASSVSRSFTILAAATAPTNSGLPVINGTLAAGQFLTATEGTWGDGGSPITGSTMQWRSTTGGNTTDITGAVSSVCYLVASPGTTLSVTVTKTNAVGSTPATSASTIAGFTCGTPPTPAAGLTLDIDPGTEAGSPAATADSTGSGLLPNSGFTVTLQPGGVVLGTGTVAGDGTFTSAVTIPSGLTPGSYSLVLTATSADGSPLTDTGWFSITAEDTIGGVSDVGPVGVDGGFLGITPARLLDTRNAGFQSLAAESVREVVVTGLNGIPADSTAVVLNVTVVAPTGPGFVTVYPCGTTRPLASNVNYAAGETIANAVTVAPGVDGKVCVFTSDATGLVVDITGGYSVTAGTGLLAGLTPSRLSDSRTAGTKIVAGAVHEVSVAGQGGVAADATSAVLNVTATEPSASGFLTVYPCGVPTPLASNVNFVAGQTVPNAVTTAVGTAGKVCVYASATTHLVVDVTADYSPSRSFGSIETTTIERLIDTRAATGPTSGAKVLAGQTQEVAVAGRAGIAADAGAVTLNVTVDGPVSSGFLTVYPCGGSLPLASNVNFVAGQTVSNAVTTALGTGGKVCVYTMSTTHIVVDANASFDGAA